MDKIPYIEHEKEAHEYERKTKKLIRLIIVLLCAFVASNIYWTAHYFNHMHNTPEETDIPTATNSVTGSNSANI